MWDQQAKARTCSCWLVAVSDRAEGLQQVPGALEGEGQETMHQATEFPSMASSSTWQAALQAYGASW